MGCQSPVSLDSLQKDCKPFIHRRFVSLSVFNSFFTYKVTNFFVNMQVFPHFCYAKMVIKSSDVQELNTATSSFGHGMRVSGLTVRKIAFQMLIFTAVGFLRPFGSKPAELERQIRPSGINRLKNEDGTNTFFVALTYAGPINIYVTHLSLDITCFFSDFDALIWALSQMRAYVLFLLNYFLHTFAPRNYISHG